MKNYPEHLSSYSEENNSDNRNTSCSIYTFNKELATKAILLHKRVVEWYQGNGAECAGIQNQHYLEPGSIRNDTLEAVMRRDHLTQTEALEKIIFQHSLPFALIKVILMYGTLTTQEDGTMNFQVPLQVTTAHTAAHYFMAELTGKIEGDQVKVWHTFLRDIIIQHYMLSLFKNRATCCNLPSLISDNHTQVESLMQQLTQDERTNYTTKDNSEGFLPPIEIDLTEIIDTTACVTVKHQEIIYTLFKQ